MIRSRCEELQFSFSIDKSFLSNCFCCCFYHIKAIIIISCEILCCCICWINRSRSQARIISSDIIQCVCNHCRRCFCIVSICIYDFFHQWSTSQTNQVEIASWCFLCSHNLRNISIVYLFSFKMIFVIHSNFHQFSSSICWCVHWVICLNRQLSDSSIYIWWKTDFIQNIVWVYRFDICSISLICLDLIVFHYRNLV